MVHLLLVALALLSTRSYAEEPEKEFSLAFTSEEWALIGDPGKFRDDLVVMKDGRRVWGRLRQVPVMHYHFGKVSLDPQQVSAIAFGRGRERDQVQVVTREGHYFVGAMDHDLIGFDRKTRAHNLRDGYHTVFEEDEIDTRQVNFVLLKQRGPLPKPDERLVSVTLSTGHRFPALLSKEMIDLTDGWRQFALDPDEIVDVRFRGGLQGYIKGEALNEELRFAFVRNDRLHMILPWSGKELSVPWSDIDRLRRHEGEFVLTTPYLFSKWVPEQMVYIPSGRLLVGETESFRDELRAKLYRPRPITRPIIGKSDVNYVPTKEQASQAVEVDAFFIDKYEVTCEEYARFCAATAHPTPAYWKRGKIPEGLATHPVVHVTFNDASAYAKWAGKRLPSEIEWERAAKGAAGFRYPYGPTYDRDLANTDSKGTRSVGSYEAAVAATRTSHLSFAKAIQDLSGNVAEWTASRYHEDHYAELAGLEETHPDPTFARQFRTIRGGSYESSSETSTTHYRLPLAEDDSNAVTGFRCAADVDPADLRRNVY